MSLMDWDAMKSAWVPATPDGTGFQYPWHYSPPPPAPLTDTAQTSSSIGSPEANGASATTTGWSSGSGSFTNSNTTDCAFKFMELDGFLAACEASVVTPTDLSSIVTNVKMNYNREYFQGAAEEDLPIPFNNNGFHDNSNSSYSFPAFNNAQTYVDPFWYHDPGVLYVQSSSSGVCHVSDHTLANTRAQSSTATATPSIPESVSAPMIDPNLDLARQLLPYNLDSAVFWGMEASQEPIFMKYFNQVAYGQANPPPQFESKFNHGMTLATFSTPSRPPPGFNSPPKQTSNEPVLTMSTWEPMASNYYKRGLTSYPTTSFHNRRDRERGDRGSRFTPKRERDDKRGGKFCSHCRDRERSWDVVHSHYKCDPSTGDITCKFLIGEFKDRFDDLDVDAQDKNENSAPASVETP